VTPTQPTIISCHHKNVKNLGWYSKNFLRTT
jgi:hypothetical protein